ncbi:MAG: hypothetical protein WBF95_09860, partial [Comamonas thiooxydans]
TTVHEEGEKQNLIHILSLAAQVKGWVSLRWKSRVSFAWKLTVWHVSLGQAVTLAESDWIRISANTMRGAYDVFRAHNQTQEPKWPDLSFDQLLELAFRDRLILNREHPLLAQLRGE